MTYTNMIDRACLELPRARRPRLVQGSLDAVSATDGARVLQMCRARESGSVERLDDLRFGWREPCFARVVTPK